MSKKTSNATAICLGDALSTIAAANELGQKAQSARASYCRHGNWLGMVPVKLPNGRLLWSAGDVTRLLAGEVLK